MVNYILWIHIIEFINVIGRYWKTKIRADKAAWIRAIKNWIAESFGNREIKIAGIRESEIRID